MYLLLRTTGVGTSFYCTQASYSSTVSGYNVIHEYVMHAHVHTPMYVQPDDQPPPPQQQQIGELTVQLNQNLGDGSFGTVYKASYQGTPVAAKYLYHPVQDYESFKHKLETLQQLTHPNLVAYYTEIMCPGPQSRRPILVMELMEKTLTQFLEEAEHDILIHLQVNLCLDITFALAYLHSQQIVHGHLTSNNVLLVGTTAKVADFGMFKLLDTQSSVTQPASYLPPEARLSHPEFSEKCDVFSLGVLLVQIITKEAPTPDTRETLTPSIREQQLDVISLGVRVVQIVTTIPQQQLAPLSEVDRRQQHIQKIASTHPLRDIALQCLKDTAMERPTVKKVVTKLNAVRYHPQYEDSLKQEREKAQREIAQLKEKLKSKEELALKQTQESEKQMGLARREIVQLQAELKLKEEFTQKQKQESEKQKEVLLQQVKERDQEIASIRLTFGKQQTLLALKKEVEVKSIQVQDRDKQILKQSQESQKQMGLAQREIAQLKEKLKSKEELALKEKQESEKQMEKLQQQLREKELRITTVQTAYGTQHQALLVMTSKLHESEGALALRKELVEKVQEKDKQIQACEMEVKKLLQQSQKKDIKISELEAWKKTIKDKITSLASAAER